MDYFFFDKCALFVGACLLVAHIGQYAAALLMLKFGDRE